MAAILVKIFVSIIPGRHMLIRPATLENLMLMLIITTVSSNPISCTSVGFVSTLR